MARGNYGGSIAHSHAFDAAYPLRQLFDSTGQETIKERITSLFWKESHRTLNLIRDNKIDLAGILAADARPRFLLPIRNPLDCAKSNLATGHVRYFRGLDQASSLAEVIGAVLDDIHWTVSQQARHPDRFHVFYEHSISRSTLLDLGAFLGLAHDEQWLSLGLQAMQIQTRYRHDESTLAGYRDAVRRRFDEWPHIAQQLLAFA